MSGAAGIEAVIVPSPRDLGDGFVVRRALPSAQRRSVGPFVFLDQMGAATFTPGQGLDVRPHPHIGLATITYLFEGEILHRDSLGTVRAIQPGAVNWMTAGRGIVHSERTAPELRDRGGRLFGFQAWIALPRRHEECDPAFAHHPADDLPVIEDAGARLRIIAGALGGRRSPVHILSELFYADATLAAGASVVLPAEHEERAIYVAEGTAEVAGVAFEAGRLVVLQPGDETVVRAPAPARLMLLGGSPPDGPRHVWWNFVSSSKARIEQAKADWRGGRFPPVPQETEFIPLPEAAPSAVDYP